MTPRMIPGVARRKMAEVFPTAVSRQFLPIGSFSLNYLLDPKSETPPPIGQVRLGRGPVSLRWGALRGALSFLRLPSDVRAREGGVARARGHPGGGDTKRRSGSRGGTGGGTTLGARAPGCASDLLPVSGSLGPNMDLNY